MWILYLFNRYKKCNIYWGNKQKIITPLLSILRDFYWSYTYLCFYYFIYVLRFNHYFKINFEVVAKSYMSGLYCGVLLFVIFLLLIEIDMESIDKRSIIQFTFYIILLFKIHYKNQFPASNPPKTFLQTVCIPEFYY